MLFVGDICRQTASREMPTPPTLSGSCRGLSRSLAGDRPEMTAIVRGYVSCRFRPPTKSACGWWVLGALPGAVSCQSRFDPRRTTRPPRWRVEETFRESQPTTVSRASSSVRPSSGLLPRGSRPPASGPPGGARRANRAPIRKSRLGTGWPRSIEPCQAASRRRSSWSRVGEGHGRTGPRVPLRGSRPPMPAEPPEDLATNLAANRFRNDVNRISRIDETEVTCWAASGLLTRTTVKIEMPQDAKNVAEPRQFAGGQAENEPFRKAGDVRKRPPLPTIKLPRAPDYHQRPPNSGRTELVRERFESRIADDPVLVVPSTDDIFGWERRLTRGRSLPSGNGGPLPRT